MKKYIITLVLALGFGMNVNAQFGQYSQGGSDAFFSASSGVEYRETENEWATLPSLPGFGSYEDQNADDAPVGSGLLLLAGMGLAYGLRKRK